jgi:high-affinity Fe2+/Pb2+ permease
MDAVKLMFAFGIVGVAISAVIGALVYLLVAALHGNPAAQGMGMSLAFVAFVLAVLWSVKTIYESSRR